MLLCLSDELLQSEVETHVSRARQQSDGADPFQASQDKRLVVAASSFPSGRLASVQLPGRGHLRHLRPSSASAVEPRGLCCILNGEPKPRLLSKRVTFRLDNGANIGLVYAPGRDKDVVVRAVRAPATRDKLPLFLGLRQAQKT